MKKIIVTGATGFIGRRLVALLAKKYGKSKILCLIKKSNSAYENEGRKILKRLGVKTKYINLDDGSGLEKLPMDISFVYHLAARTDTSEPGHDSTNHIGTKRLVNSLNLSQKTHFIYTSTTAFMSGRKDCTKPINEKSKPTPTNEYGRSKLAAEKFLINKSKDSFKLTIIRFPTVYGPRPRKNSFFDVLNSLADRRSFFSRINWPGKTSLIHVEDAAKIILRLSNKSYPTNKVNLLIATSESLTLSQINKMVYRAKRISYKEITIPKIFWNLASFLRKYHSSLEHFMPRKIYNLIWRFFLLVDDVIYCRSEKLSKYYPKFKFKKLDNSIDKIITKPRGLFSKVHSLLFLTLFTLFFAINLFSLRKTLNLSFPDDDWLGILFYQSGLVRSLFEPYGFQQISFGLLYKLIGYQPFWFYLYSIVMRALVAFTIFYFVYHFTKKASVSFLSGLFFSLVYTGIEATEVVNNVNTYLAIVLALVFVIYHIEHIKKTKTSNHLVGAFLFGLTILSAPIRIYMFPLWILTLHLLIFISNPNRETFKQLFRWQLIIIFVMLLLIKLGTFGASSSTSNSFLTSFLESFTTIGKSIVSGEQKYFRYFATGISNSIAPDILVNEINFIQHPTFYIGFTYLIISAFYVTRTLMSKKRNLQEVLIAAFLLWVPIFFLVAWLVWLGREPILVSYRRYLLLPSVGFFIVTGLTLNEISRNKTLYRLMLAILSIISILQFVSLQNYLDSIAEYRDFKYEKALIESLQGQVSNLPKGLSYFYFESDEQMEKIHNTIQLGFPTKMAVLYNISLQDNSTHPPHFTTSIEELRSVITNGEALAKHGYEAKPLPSNNIYAFRIQHGMLVNIKDEVLDQIRSSEQTY